ncbi:hypothetical protein [Tenacibaculum sp. 190524A05c]|uniref:hypothetical protein n=1 Tax=Tenacibaculum platacis TaxID=3137852 RepID=UPI0032B179D0
MKKLLFYLFLISSFLVNAQVPQGISYQAVAFKNDGSVIANENIGIKISILDSSITGTAVYTETHTKTTNDKGLFSLNIGHGDASVGEFSSIKWGINTKFLKVEIDPAGGNNYTISGTNQLMSTPYALYAETINVESLPATITAKSKVSKVIVIYTETNAYGFSQFDGGSGSWKSISLSGAPLGAIASNDQIVVYTDTNAYGFSQFNGGSSSWKATSLNGTPIGAVASNNSIVVYTDTNAYGFSQFNGGSSSWKATSLNGTAIGAAASNLNIVVYTNSNAYGFSQFDGGSSSWKPISLSGTPIEAIASSINIVVYTSSNAYGFSQFNGGSSSWKSTTLNGTPINTVSK